MFLGCREVAQEIILGGKDRSEPGLLNEKAEGVGGLGILAGGKTSLVNKTTKNEKEDCGTKGIILLGGERDVWKTRNLSHSQKGGEIGLDGNVLRGGGLV